MYLIWCDAGKVEWFGGDVEALQVYRLLTDLAHLWDDLVDKDKELTEDAINYAFSIPLVLLPSNPYWRKIEPEVRAMWVPVIAAYALANRMEKTKDTRKLEISYSLRNSMTNIISYMVVRAHGCIAAIPHLEEVWLTAFNDSVADYTKEHTDARQQP